MKTILQKAFGIYIFFSLFITLQVKSQNPGTVISELFINPVSTDSCKEHVELLITQKH